MNRSPAFLTLLGLACITPHALALTPAEVFEKVSPSVWSVRAVDAQQRPLNFGSAVVIGQGRVVTNCHVLAKASAVQLRRENVVYDASLEHADVERDLCILAAAGLTAPAVEVATLSSVKVGNRAYVVGNPQRLALTLSEGLISGLRPDDPRLPMIQTTAPISPGSSGGGLFDEQGRMVGVTTLILAGRDRLAQNLNFAVPAEWIVDVPQRAKEQYSRRQTRARIATDTMSSPAAPPSVGTTWKYNFRDQQFRSEQQFTVRLTSVDGWSIADTLATDSPKPLDARQVAFSGRLIDGRSMLELAPYLLMRTRGERPAELELPRDYPLGSSDEPFRLRIQTVQSEQIAVPAGVFKAIRIDVTGERTGYGLGLAGGLWNSMLAARFRYTIWYVPEIGRYAMSRHQQWNPSGHLIGDDLVELVEHRQG